MGLKRQKERIKKIIRLLNQAFGIYKLQIIVLIALGFIGGILEGIGINALIPMLSFVTGDSGNEFDFITQIIRKFFDALNIDFSLKFLLIFICTLFILKAIVLLVFNYVKIKIATDYERNFRVKLLKNTINADWAFLLKQKIGYIENTIMNDIATGSMLLNSISGIIMITTGLLIYVVVALNISAFITFITLIIGIFILFIFKPLLYRIKVAAFNAQKMNKKVAHLINENLIGAKTIKSIGAEDHVINFGKSFFEELKRLRIKLFLLGSISMSAIQPITIIFVCAIFAISYKSSNFNFTSLIVIIYLIQRIFSYIQQFQTNFNKLMKAAPFLASALRYDDLVKKNKESGGRGKKFIFNKNIKFNNISFSYNNNEKKVLKNVNFEIKKGEMIGVIGSSGSGKTTLVDLVLRLFKPNKGNILADDLDVKKINMKEWRKNIGYVSQDIFLLNDSIKNNIKFFNDSITDKEIERVAKITNINDFVEELPNRFDTAIGERGVELSVGQRQRIVLARILARNPKILILDEATSALDNESEKKIQEAIEKLKGSMTIIIIAHRLSTVMNVDKLLVVKNGMIEEENNPKEFIKKVN